MYHRRAFRRVSCWIYIYIYVRSGRRGADLLKSGRTDGGVGTLLLTPVTNFFFFLLLEEFPLVAAGSRCGVPWSEK